MYETAIFFIVTSFLFLISTFILSLTTYLYNKRWKSYKRNLEDTQNSHESLKKVNTTLEGLIGQKNNEIDILKIEVDANVEQLGKEREDHTLRENQVKRIKDILEEDEGEE